LIINKGLNASLLKIILPVKQFYRALVFSLYLMPHILSRLLGAAYKLCTRYIVLPGCQMLVQTNFVSTLTVTLSVNDL